MIPIRRKYIGIALAAAGLIVALLFGIAAYALRSGALKPRVTSALADALNCDVSLDTLDVQLVPVIKVTGTKLSIRLRGRPGLPPFVYAERFTLNLGLLSVLRRHIETIHLDGLQLNVPPRWADSLALAADNSAAASPLAPAPSLVGRALYGVDHVVAQNARLNFVGKMKNNRPLDFAIHDLRMENATIDRPVQFRSRITNPIPEGIVESTGTIGPWNRDDPTETPMAGNFDLPIADLSTINGIGGTTSARGTFRGVLNDIHVAGTSETPDFSLDLGGKPVPLTTTFMITVDGTSGTTRLDRVDATLIGTPMLVTGTFTNLPGPHNNDVTLAVAIDKGRIEDLLRLAIDSAQPVLTGNISLNARVLLPPGATSVRNRLSASGTFGLGGGRFNDAEMQRQLQELSRRGQGKDADEVISRVATNFSGQFSLGEGVLTLPAFTFTVPGANISLSGRYTMGTEAVHFTGTMRLQASLSDAVGGFKSIFIKPFNSLFRKNGSGAVLPIEITGTRSQPKFDVKVKQAIKKES
jgi:hypothetical protein